LRHLLVALWLCNRLVTLWLRDLFTALRRTRHKAFRCGPRFVGILVGTAAVIRTCFILTTPVVLTPCLYRRHRCLAIYADVRITRLRRSGIPRTFWSTIHARVAGLCALLTAMQALVFMLTGLASGRSNWPLRKPGANLVLVLAVQWTSGMCS
jgi:hypothetical protein